MTVARVTSCDGRVYIFGSDKPETFTAIEVRDGSVIVFRVDSDKHSWIVGIFPGARAAEIVENFDPQTQPKSQIGQPECNCQQSWNYPEKKGEVR